MNDVLIIGIGGLATLLYLIAAVVLLYDFRRQRPVERARVLPLATGAAVLHGGAIAMLGFSGSGINMSFYTSLSLVAWVVIVLTLIGSLARPLEVLGIVLYPLAGVMLALQLAFGRGREVVVTYGWQLDLHVALAVFAFAILTIGAAQAMLLAAQERALRRHRFTGLLAVMPPMDAMEHLLFQMISLGFALLTLTLVSGLLFVDNLMAQHLVHKTVLSSIGWIVFGTLLWGRWRYGWRGRTAIRMTLMGMAVLLLAYFGSKLVLELILHRI